ncbi:hypothetical protein OL233_05125 [Vagococcus sp. PNs007]|uniref:Uncharacterized protein n=1 Tax=Vagococcus proximus TaxID=2991417 RepID=A0ABT5X0Z4_9ENTE|nr:hypothetical protein [Vagococcus proximus]MDF0479665.1 hypothetical protein [Vagococcus proximus]
MNLNTAINHIQTMSSDKFTRSKNSIHFYVYNQGFTPLQLAQKYNIRIQDVQSLLAIVGSPRKGVSSHNNYAWSIQGDMEQTKKWITLYFKSLTKTKISTGEFVNLHKFLWDKQQIVKNKQFDAHNAERLQRISKEQQLKKKKHYQTKKVKYLNAQTFEAKLQEADAKNWLKVHSKIKIGRFTLFTILLGLGTLSIAIQSSIKKTDSLTIIIYISLLTIAFSIYNQLRPKKYSAIMNISLFLIGLLIMPYSILFFILITLITFQKSLLKLVRNINLKDN